MAKAAAILASKDQKVKVNDNDPSADFLDQKIVSTDGSVDITTDPCNCKLDLSVQGTSGFQEQIIKVSVSHDDFTAAAATETINPTEFASLPAGTVLLFYKIYHTESFDGGSTTTAGLKIQLGGTSMIGANVLQAPASTTYVARANDSSADDFLDHDATDSIGVTLSITGDTIDNLTTGEAEIWIKIATLV